MLLSFFHVADRRLLPMVLLISLSLPQRSQQYAEADDAPQVATSTSSSSALEVALRREGYPAIAQAARQQGDAARGAIAFHQPHIGCVKCHSIDSSPSPLGPPLAEAMGNAKGRLTDEQLVESILEPSKMIRQGFESVVLELNDGRTITGLIAKESPGELTLRDPSQPGRPLTIAKSEIETRSVSKQSLMPAGLVNQMTSRQQLLDLVRYLTEIRDGGLARATSLQPPPSAYAAEIPEYESRIDHAGILSSLDQPSLERGQAIYQRVCQNCHGTKDQPGSLPTSLRFASGQFKNGSDPLSMYRTLTRGFGLMVPQIWMVPQQKYDVIHYIRETYLKPHNPSQYVTLDAAYLASLPKGDTRGPAPRVIEPWATMDYGPSLINTYEVGRDGKNFAYKGIATRLDPGPGGVSRGNRWMIFDHDTMRMAAAWTGTGFIDWQGIHFDGRHGAHPHLLGDVVLQNPTGPGWADPRTGSFDDNQRVIGRDERRYGPLPREWARYRGLYHFEDRTIVSYTVGSTEVLELPSSPANLSTADNGANAASITPVFERQFQLGPRATPLKLLVATHPKEAAQRLPADPAALQVVRFGVEPAKSSTAAITTPQPLRFQGASFVEVKPATAFGSLEKDFTITARIKTKADGSIFALAKSDGPWVPNGKSFFIRGGRLVLDVGWVGAVTGQKQVTDNRWHDVALRWTRESGLVEFFVDGKPDGQGHLRAKADLPEAVIRIGFTSTTFPEGHSYFQGELRDVRFFERPVASDELAKPDQLAKATDGLVAHWSLAQHDESYRVVDSGKGKRDGVWRSQAVAVAPSLILAGIEPAIPGSEWLVEGERLVLQLPAGERPLRFNLAVTRQTDDEKTSPSIASFANHLTSQTVLPLDPFTKGGPARWRERLVTRPQLGRDDGAVAVDLLVHPADNPWLAQMRFTGIDFLPDANRAVVCAWDGDVWLIEGLLSLGGKPQAQRGEASEPKLTWQRIASGLFQPLGIKYVNNAIHVTCRDQLVILRDLNQDGETDFYESLNNDHQVTEHFHEFAMGLQVDEAGSFYYAKSARHALPAVVPHHGTLLRVTPDGRQTEIIANGFRAANGVCLNPDGTFVVTDQEGHWNPKNRINWVERGGFYGNMFGYHDVTDSSDRAMSQPLCWITNAFDRSPAELLWVPRGMWGPLSGSLINLSYGYGKVFVVPFEKLDGQRQGGMCALPIPPLPTGIMRGRFHPIDHQLYACGMFAWAGSATAPGGLYRLRLTGKPLHLPAQLKARTGALEVTFTEPIDRVMAVKPEQYSVKVWSLKRSANYGSQHHDEKPLKVTAASLSEDGCTVRLTIPELAPTWGMELVVRGQGATAKDGTAGEKFERVIHNSIYQLP